MKDDLGGLARILATFRRRSGLTIEELAERAGVSVRAIGDVERGVTKSPQRRTVEAIAKALALSDNETQLLLSELRRLRTAPQQRGYVRTAVPAATADFVGRNTELKTLRAAVEDADGVRVAAIVGGAGLGKTALAMQVASDTAKGFPAGLVFLDVRSFGGTPAEPAQLLHDALRSVGTPEDDIPVDIGARADLWRRRLDDEPALVVLDNVRDLPQVVSLLPAGGPSFALVTSRNVGFSGPGITPVRLAELTPDESLALLEKTISASIAPNESAAAAEVLTLCDHNPLAIRVAGLRLRSRSAWTLHYLAQRLRDTGERMALLDAGPLSVEAALAVSYEQLSPRAAELFRGLASMPGPSATIELLAAALVLPVDETAAAAAELVGVGLLVESRQNRVLLHDLARAFGQLRLRADLGPDEVARVRSGIVASLLTTATAFGHRCDPTAQEQTDPDETTEAITWLTEELEHWEHALRWAEEDGDFPAVLTATEAMHWASEHLLLWQGWTGVFDRAARAAVALADDAAEASFLGYLSWAHRTSFSAYEPSRDAAQSALRAARRAGNLSAEAWAAHYLAITEMTFGEAQPALTLALEAFRLAEKSAVPEVIAASRVVLARSYFDAGRVDEAEEELYRLIDWCRDPSVNGLPPRFAMQQEGTALSGLAAIAGSRGDLDASIEYYRRSLNAYEQGMRTPGAVLGTNEYIARTLHAAGRDDEALAALQVAIELRHATGGGRSDNYEQLLDEILGAASATAS